MNSTEVTTPDASGAGLLLPSLLQGAEDIFAVSALGAEALDGRSPPARAPEEPAEVADGREIAGRSPPAREAEEPALVINQLALEVEGRSPPARAPEEPALVIDKLALEVEGRSPPRARRRSPFLSRRPTCG